MGYICVEERVSEAPPAVVRRICGYVGEGEGEGGGGGRERNNPSSKPLDKHSTPKQTIDTRSKTL